MTVKITPVGSTEGRIQVGSGLPIEIDTAGGLHLHHLNGGQLAGMRNKIINGAFMVNQRDYVSGAATTVGQYTLDRWKVTGTGGIAFTTVNNKTTLTIPVGQTIQQVIEGLNLQSGNYVLSWEGTAQGRIGSSSYGNSGVVTATIIGGTDTTIEFGEGTVSNVQLELGTVASPFEHRPYGIELLLCQRYYERIINGDLAGGAFSSTNLFASLRYNVEKRATPTLTSINNGSWVGNNGGGILHTPTFGAIGLRAAQLDVTSFTGSVQPGLMYVFRGFDYRVSAEL